FKGLISRFHDQIFFAQLPVLAKLCASHPDDCHAIAQGVHRLLQSVLSLIQPAGGVVIRPHHKDRFDAEPILVAEFWTAFRGAPRLSLETNEAERTTEVISDRVRARQKAQGVPSRPRTGAPSRPRTGAPSRPRTGAPT